MRPAGAVEWAPQWAPLVRGWHGPRDEDGEQLVGAECTKCLGSFQRKCISGQPRRLIAAFAQSHTHRPPLEKT